MTLRIVYANQPFPDSWKSLIFLLGPTPRKNSITGEATAESWRPAAIKYLQDIGYDGVVAIPEDEDGVMRHSYDDQIEWEETGLNFADIIIAWMPRDLTYLGEKDGQSVLSMPALTSNDEWGFWKGADPAKLILGTPPDAEKVRYQQYYAQKHHIPIFETLEDVCSAAYTRAKMLEWKSPVGTRNRSGGARHVPLHIWRTESFQNWYQNLVAAGNRLESARVEWVFRVGPKLEHILFWSLHVDIFVTSENRHKTNEVVIGRPDISTIMLYERAENILDSRIVTIREFRSPVSNRLGYVYELAGGSSWKAGQDPSQVAADECKEEVGITLDPKRFVELQTRQLAATTSAHRAHLFGVALSTAEMDAVVANEHVVHGVSEDSEQTWANVQTYREVLQDDLIDWSMLGMIASVLSAPE